MNRREICSRLLKMRAGIDSMRAEIDSIVAALGTEIAQQGAPPKPTNGDAGPFRGRPMTSRYAGTCAVCLKAYTQGDRIVWSGEQRRGAHLGCGAPDNQREARA